MAPLLEPLRFDLLNLREAAGVAFGTGKAGAQKGLDQFTGHFHADDAGSQAEHVGRVVFHRLMGGKGIVAGARAHATKFVGGYAGSNAATTNQNGALGATRLQFFRYEPGHIGIVDGIRRTGAQIGDLVAQISGD